MTMFSLQSPLISSINEGRERDSLCVCVYGSERKRVHKGDNMFAEERESEKSSVRERKCACVCV